MNPWLLLIGVLLIAGLLPGLCLAMRDDAVTRLVGLQASSAVAVLVMVAFSAAVGQSSYLIVPLALALLSFAGTLVFTRLLAER